MPETADTRQLWQHFKGMAPEELQVPDGRLVRDLTTREECHAAMEWLHSTVIDVKRQIAMDEMDRSEMTQNRIDWRFNAMRSIKWKHKTILAIELHMKQFPKPAIAEPREALIRVIRGDIGEERYGKYLQDAREAHPHINYWTAVT